MRNAIVHNPNAKVLKPIAEPHDIIVERFEMIRNKLYNPPRALDEIAINASDIYSVSLEDNAIEVMDKMNKNTYTHVPVIENGQMIGVFSENTLFSYVAENKESLIDEGIEIKEFKEYLPIDKHLSEVFVFADRESNIFDIQELFKEQFKNQKRIAVVFITHNGKNDEKVLGMITPWDITGGQI